MTQSAWSTIVARVVAQMQTIADIGNVFDRKRLIFTEADYTDALSTTIGAENKARAWMVTIEAVQTKPEDAAGDMQWDRRVAIEGFLQIEDANASELGALGLAESIIRVLWNDARTTRLNDSILYGKPPMLVSNEPRVFGPFVIHYVKLVMPITTSETP